MYCFYLSKIFSHHCTQQKWSKSLQRWEYCDVLGDVCECKIAWSRSLKANHLQNSRWILSALVTCFSLVSQNTSHFSPQALAFALYIVIITTYLHCCQCMASWTRSTISTTHTFTNLTVIDTFQCMRAGMPLWLESLHLPPQMFG